MPQENGTKKVKNPEVDTFRGWPGQGQKAECAPCLPCCGGIPALEPMRSLPVENRCASVPPFWLLLSPGLPRRSDRMKARLWSTHMSILPLWPLEPTSIRLRSVAICDPWWPGLWQQLLFRSPGIQLESWKSFPSNLCCVVLRGLLLWTRQGMLNSWHTHVLLNEGCPFNARECLVGLISGHSASVPDCTEVSRPRDKMLIKLVLPENYFRAKIHRREWLQRHCQRVFSAHPNNKLW